MQETKTAVQKARLAGRLGGRMRGLLLCCPRMTHLDHVTQRPGHARPPPPRVKTSMHLSASSTDPFKVLHQPPASQLSGPRNINFLHKSIACVAQCRV